MGRLRQLLKTTAVRLTLLYSVVFGLLAVGVVFYISYNTGRLLIQQFQIAVDEEVQEIARATRVAGVRNLVPMIERRSRNPGANLYLIADPNGRIIAGNVGDIDRTILRDDGWKLPPFAYEQLDDPDGRSHRAVARVFTLPGNLRLLVGRDIGEAERFRSIVLRASTLSLAVMVATGLLLWFFVGRRALRHIDSVAGTTRRIVAGDLSQRLPMSGSGDEFDRLAGSLNSIIARVERLDTGVRQMSDSIAHDLKTPLTRLRNRADNVLLSRNKADRDAAAQDVVAEADAIIRTFDALLMISQIEAGARPARFEKINAADVILGVHDLIEPLAEEQNITLDLVRHEQSDVKANRELLTQALVNLVDNAIKYGVGKKKRSIELSCTVDGANVVLSVADNGAGIAKTDRDTVKERFSRLDSSRTKPGAGLGMSLVQAIADMHGGAFLLEDNHPGLLAKLCLPLAR